MSSPPFANLAAFATKLGELVPDSKSPHADADFVSQALDEIGKQVPAVETQDIGDGSTYEWSLAASPFTRWEEGFSDKWRLEVEDLDADGNPYRPPITLTQGSDFWTEVRYESSVPVRYLCFDSVPASTKVRVRFRRRPIVTSSTVELGAAQHMALVYKAAELKCDALAALYQSSVDPSGGADGFSALAYAAEYREGAARWRRRCEAILGQAKGGTSFRSARAKPARLRVFRRGEA